MLVFYIPFPWILPTRFNNIFIMFIFISVMKFKTPYSEIWRMMKTVGKGLDVKNFPLLNTVSILLMFFYIVEAVKPPSILAIQFFFYCLLTGKHNFLSEIEIWSRGTSTPHVLSLHWKRNKIFVQVLTELGLIPRECYRVISSAASLFRSKTHFLTVVNSSQA